MKRGCPTGEQISFLDGWMNYGLLQQTVEKKASATRAASLEPKDEFIEVEPEESVVH